MEFPTKQFINFKFSNFLYPMVVADFPFEIVAISPIILGSADL